MSTIYMLVSSWKSQFSACLLLMYCGKICLTSRKIKAIWESAPDRSGEGMLIYKELSESTEKVASSATKWQSQNGSCPRYIKSLKFSHSELKAAFICIDMIYFLKNKPKPWNNQLHFARNKYCKRKLLIIYIKLTVITGCIIFHFTCTV